MDARVHLSGSPMPETAFIVRVPEAEACVNALRERFDVSVQLGVPAHITVLVPFMSPDLVTDTVLQDAQDALSQEPSFAFSLERVARFPATTYLAPEPAEPFIEITRALVRRFPEYPPFSGQHESIVPHLTVANGNAEVAETVTVELEALLRLHGQIRSVCASVALLENSSGRLKELHRSFGSSSSESWLYPLPHTTGFLSRR